MSVREPSRFAPAGYTSRYLLSLPTHDLGERNVRCERCGALHFLGEKVKPSSKREPRFMTCCKDGLVKLDPICEPPQPFRRLWTSEDSDCKKFRRRAREYNCAFAFTSFKFTSDDRLERQGIRGGLRSFATLGQVYHQSGAVARPGQIPKYAQLYFLDPDAANSVRVEQRRLDPEIVEVISMVIVEHNPFQNYYHRALESLQVSNAEQEEAGNNGECRAILDVNFQLVVRQGADRRRENLPTVSEFAAILPDVSDKDSRDIILFIRNGDGSLSTRFQYIHRGHPAYLPLHYVLFYPYGNPGYRWKMPLARRHGRVLGDEGEEDDTETSPGCASAR